MAGIEGSLEAGADVIVNTDADNQYCANDIEKLLAILSGEAEIVIGARPIDEISHLPIKKYLQRIGSWAVRLISGTTIDDAPSAFRAFSADAAKTKRFLRIYLYA